MHCADWATRGLNQSCLADVDPDGEGSLFGPVQVECDFDTTPGQAVTVIRELDQCVLDAMGFQFNTFRVMLNLRL